MCCVASYYNSIVTFNETFWPHFSNAALAKKAFMVFFILESNVCFSNSSKKNAFIFMLCYLRLYIFFKISDLDTSRENVQSISKFIKHIIVQKHKTILNESYPKAKKNCFLIWWCKISDHIRSQKMLTKVCVILC